MWEGPFAHSLLDLMVKHYEDSHPFQSSALHTRWEKQEQVERLKAESPRAYALLMNLQAEKEAQ